MIKDTGQATIWEGDRISALSGEHRKQMSQVGVD
jgi:hypothetical protein